MTIQYRERVTAGDGAEFVISDGSLDRHGTRINPAGWRLDQFNRNPVALFGHSGGFPIGRWENVRAEDDRLVGRLALAAKGTSARIDEIRKLVEQGILRAVSAGFNVVKYGAPGGNYDFEEQELYEASLVSVGSNTNALARARALNISNETMSLAFGEHAGVWPWKGFNGEHADTRTADGRGPPPKANPTMEKQSLSQRIESAQTDLNAKRDRLAEINAADVLDLDAIEALNDQISVAERTVTALKTSESKIGTSAGGATQKVAAPAVQRLPLGVVRKEVDPLDLFFRRAVVRVQSVIQNKDPDEVLAQRYPGHEPTAMITRAAVLGASTTVTGWAAELVETATTAFLNSLQPASVYPALAAAGTKVTFGPNSGNIKIPSRASTPSISGSFVGEASPIPVRKLGLTTKTLTPHKMGVISVFSREIAKYSNPAIEGIVRRAIIEDTAVTIDTLLLDATAGSAIRPAGLTNGVASLTPTAVVAGQEYNAIIADLKKLYAPFAAANRGTNLRLLMNPAQAISLSMYPGPGNTGFNWSDQFTSRFSPIVSTSIPVADIFLIDADDFLTATGDTPEFDLSEEAVLHMEDTTPLAISTPGAPATVAAPAASMFQTAQIAVRMLLDITWNTRRAGALTWIDNVLW